MKKEFKPLGWLVKNFDCNRQVIEDYDILKYRENEIKKLKKKCATKEEFAEELRREYMYHYWSRAQYELIIERTEDGRIWLLPWCGCREPEKVKIDVTDDNTFDWQGFAEEHISKQIFSNEAKIDVYAQLVWQWDSFVDYCWYTRLKYERDNPKFHR